MAVFSDAVAAPATNDPLAATKVSGVGAKTTRHACSPSRQSEDMFRYAPARYSIHGRGHFSLHR